MMIPLLAPPSTVTGRLEIVAFASRVLGNARSVRVWFPPAFDRRRAASYPVLVMQDGQNLFDGATSFIPGGEWRVDESATMLIGAGLIPPIVVVGVDNAGADRGREYLPTAFAWRGSTLGGGADDYLRMLDGELFPMLAARYGLSFRRFGMAGSSLGAVVSLYAAKRFGARVDRLALVSPSVWVNGREPLGWASAVASGTRIWLDIGEDEGAEAVGDARLLRDAFRRAGPRVTYVEAPRARHDEAAWSARFPTVLTTLYGRTMARRWLDDGLTIADDG